MKTFRNCLATVLMLATTSVTSWAQGIDTKLQEPYATKLRISTGDLRDTFVNIRKTPGGDLLTAVQEQEFTLEFANSINQGGTSWHKIRLNTQGNKFAYVAGINNVYLFFGALRVAATGQVVIRSSADFTNNIIAKTYANTTFDVLERFTRNGQIWSKVFLRDLDGKKIGFISETESAKALPTYLRKAEVNAQDAQINEADVPVNMCGSGSAPMAYLKSHQVVFRNPQFGLDRYTINGQSKVITLPRGTRVKALGQGSIPVLDGFMPIELIIPSSQGFTAQVGYLRRSEVKINQACFAYGPDMVRARGLQHWGGSEYRSFSALARSTNLSLSLTRVDGTTAAAQRDYSFLENAVFSAELKALNKTGSDLDQMGCPTGSLYNANESSSLHGYCRPFIHGTSTSLQPIYAGGICGASTLTHRAVFRTGLPIVKYHNHGYYYPSSYGLNDEMYNTPGGQGTEAEVAWDTYSPGGRDWSGYKFFNDSQSDLTLVTTAWYDRETDITHTTLQFYGTTAVDRNVYINSVKPLNEKGVQFNWVRGIQFRSMPTRRVTSQLESIASSFDGGWRYDNLKTHYFCLLVKDDKGVAIIDPKTGKNRIDCRTQKPDFAF